MGAESVVTFELSTFLLILFGGINLIVLGPVSWILGTAIKDLRGLQDNFEKLKEDVHLNYVRKPEYNKDIEEIKLLLKEIFEKLNNKADK